MAIAALAATQAHPIFHPARAPRPQPQADATQASDLLAQQQKGLESQKSVNLLV